VEEQIAQRIYDTLLDSCFAESKNYIDFINDYELKLDLETQNYTLNEEAFDNLLERMTNVVLKNMSDSESIGGLYNEFFSNLDNCEKREFASHVCRRTYENVVSVLVEQLKTMNCEGAGKIQINEQQGLIRFIEGSPKDN
jgi:hypothetical protein